MTNHFVTNVHQIRDDSDQNRYPFDHILFRFFGNEFHVSHLIFLLKTHSSQT